MSAAETVNKVSTCLPVVGADKFHYAHVLRALQNPYGFHQDGGQPMHTYKKGV
jgi:hypothetical protein